MHRQNDKSISGKGDGDTDRKRQREREREKETEREREEEGERDQYIDRRAQGHLIILGHRHGIPGESFDSQ